MSPRFPLILALSLLGLSAPRLAAQTLISYYSFDASTVTTSGSQITSIVGTGVGSLANRTMTPMGTNPTVDASGKFGGAADFTGALGFETNTFGTGTTSLGKNFSISFWMKTADVTANSSSYVFMTGADSGPPQNAVLFGYVSGKTELYATSGAIPGRRRASRCPRR